MYQRWRVADCTQNDATTTDAAEEQKGQSIEVQAHKAAKAYLEWKKSNG